MSEQQRAMLYKTEAKKMYGLTEAMLRDIGDPDKRVKNPHYRSGPLASLYSIERLEKWVDENQAWIGKVAGQREIRSKAMSAVARRKRRELVSWARSVSIEVLPLHQGKKLRRIMKANGYTFITEGAQVAFLRHRYTNYERLLTELAGKVGCAVAYRIIKERVNAELEGRLGIK